MTERQHVYLEGPVQHSAGSHGPAHPPVIALFATFVALMLLLAATVGISEIDLGRWNFAASTAIAVAKATLIILIFMNIRYSPPLARLVACAGFFWLLILFGLAMGDYFTRPGWF